MPNNQPVKVLVVDDEANISDLLKVSLKFQGFDVETADNGQDALALANTYKPDAFILDVMMPSMDGFTLLNKLREAGHEARDERFHVVLFLHAAADGGLGQLDAGRKLDLL